MQVSALIYRKMFALHIFISIFSYFLNLPQLNGRWLADRFPSVLSYCFLISVNKVVVGGA